MKIEIRFRGLESSNALREHVGRQVHFHLSRFGSEVSTVLVRVADINGPKGGLDKRCQVTVRGPRVGSTTLDDLSGDPYSAADSAIERVGHTVGRRLEQMQEGLRAPPRPLQGLTSHRQLQTVERAFRSSIRGAS